MAVKADLRFKFSFLVWCLMAVLATLDCLKVVNMSGVFYFGFVVLTIFIICIAGD
jgi:hypothetical protein